MKYRYYYIIMGAMFLSVVLYGSQLFSSKTAYALDLPQYQQTNVAGNTGTDYGNTIETDSQGNLFIGGNFGTGTIDFNPGAGVDNFTNAGGADIFLTKFNADGTYAWTKVWGGTGSEGLYNIAFDSSDNIYIAAEFATTVDLDPNAGVDNYTSAGSVDISLIKLNADGTYAYSKVMGSTSHDRLHTVQYSSSDGFIYIGGKFSGTVDFDPSGGTDNKVSAGNYDAFLSKFNTDGTYVWTKTWGGTDRDTVNDMALDSSGNIYLAGVFRNTVNFDTTGGTDNKTSAGLDDAFLTRYNADGTYGWTKTWGSTSNDFSFNIRVSPSNDVYIIGSYQLTVDFDPTGSTNSITSAGSEDSYVSKFESDGTYDLTYTWGGALMDEVNAITFDSDGRWYIGGFFNGTIDFNPTGGTDNIASNGLYDQFFSVFDSNDAYLTTKTFGSATEVNWFDEILYELHASGSKLYLTGFYNGTTDFNPAVGTDNYTSAGGWDIYYSTYSLDSTAPVVSAITSTSASSSSTITWTTNEISSSKVDYGLTNSYGTSTSEADTSPRVLSHSVLLSSLLPCTTYHYRVISTDSLVNTTTGSDNQFTTLGCGGGLPLQAFNPPLVPINGYSILINGGAKSTASNNVTLSFNAGSDVVNMAISSSLDFSGVGQEKYSSTKAWDLCTTNGLPSLTGCELGTKTVYAKFYTAYGQPSSVVQASIDYLTGTKSSTGSTIKETIPTGAAHPVGVNIRNLDGTVYTITPDGARRPYTSAASFLSYGFNTFKNVLLATTGDLSLPMGSFIAPRDGFVVCSDRGLDKGTCYLITDGKRAPFTSAKVFTDLGFTFAKSSMGDVSFMELAPNISSSTISHPAGVLVKTGKTIYITTKDGLIGIPSMAVLTSWGYKAEDTILSNEYDKLLPQIKVLETRSAGDLK